MKSYLSLIKFSHTIFALPFALVGYFLAVSQVGQVFSWRLLVLVVLCMVFARSAAMAFNRYLDRDVDKANPRTATREIPAGILSPRAVLFFVVANSLAFVLTTYFINPLCLALSPIALLVILGYSATKRFTSLCHFVLGLGLSLAPIGAYLAVTGKFAVLPVLLGVVVLLWVAGFDIIYALQDEDLDRSLGLHSTPVWLGRAGAMRFARLLHALAAAVLIYTAWSIVVAYPMAGGLTWAAAACFILLLIYQHSIVGVNDLSRVGLAFFTTNGIASVIFATLVIADLLF